MYALGQIISRFVIDPIHEQKKVIGEIADALVFYANYYSNPGTGSKEKMDEASERLRQLSALLRSRTNLIPCHGVFEKTRIVVSSSAAHESAAELMGLSNSIHGFHGPGVAGTTDKEVSLSSPREPPLSVSVIGVTDGDLSLWNYRRVEKIKDLLNLRIS